MNNKQHCNEQTYIITQDIGHRIAGLRALGIKTPHPGDVLYDRFHESVKARVSSALPHVTVETFDMNGLVDEVWSAAIRIKESIKDAIVVSSCSEVASARRGHIVEINRIVNQDGEVIGLGPRPGHPSLSRQIDSLAVVANGNPVVLAEDGAFTGGTLDTLLSALRSRRINVTAIVAGICFPDAVANIKERFKGEVVVVKEIHAPFEWMPDHDFFPFVPNCGRVFGSRFGDEYLPHYSHDGMSFCFPYILPFGDPVKWASIPQEHAHSFSLHCLEQSLDLFRKIDDLNGEKVMLRDVVKATPRISIPMTKGSSTMPSTDLAVSEFLSDICTEMS
jgi:hypothetical protein